MTNPISDLTEQQLVEWHDNLTKFIFVNDLKLDRNYVESKCHWQELTDRVVSWRIKD